MKYIDIYEDTHQYIINHYLTLSHLTIVKNKKDTGHLMISILLKNLKSDIDIDKIQVLSCCSVVGMLDRYHIQAMIKWYDQIIVDHKVIAQVKSHLYENYIIIDINLNIIDENSDICMNNIRKKKYNYNQLMIALSTFISIYYSLYQTHEYYKILDYANDISYLKNKNIELKNYGVCYIGQLDENNYIDIGKEKIKISEIRVI